MSYMDFIDMDIDKPKLIYPKEVIKIGENITVETGFYRKRVENFYDVVLKNKEKEIFLGRFQKVDDTVKTKYNDGKILVFSERFTADTNSMNIVKVYSLYDILDDTFINCTEAEALNIFDKTIDSSHLINGDNPLRREDPEKKRRL